MKLIYITLPVGILMAAGGVILMVASSRARVTGPSASPISGTDPVHPVTIAMAREAALLNKKDAPTFSLSDARGKVWSREQLADGKPLYLYFILPDCPCSTEAEPIFHQLYKQFKGSVNFVGVIAGDQRTADNWAKLHEMPYRYFADPQLRTIHAFHAKHSVYNVLITRNGKIDTMWPGYSQSMLLNVNKAMSAEAGLPVRPFDTLYAPLKMTSGCFFPVDQGS